MYLNYWELARKPFENDFDSDFCYPSQTYQSALLKMLYVVEQGHGAGMMVGGIGCGKSYLISQLSRELPEQFSPIVHMVFPQMTAEELLGYMAVELGVNPRMLEGSPGGRLDKILKQIELHLQQYCIGGQHPVIVIDEAHTIVDPEVLQCLQLIMNHQQHPQRKFSLLLVGENGLLAPVKRLSQLDERISIRCAVGPMTREETKGYIEYRLVVAGREKPIFTPEGTDCIFELSGGVPRRVNRLCDLCLLVGYAENLTQITETEVEAVSDELLTAVAE